MKNPLSVFSRRSTLPTHGPWRAMSELENEMERWFGDRFPVSSDFGADFDFTPSCDFRETDKEYILKVDIPGIRKDEIKIEVDGNRLTISGERHEEKEEKDAKKYFSESYFGSFMRSFSLPMQIDESKVKASYSDGVLKLSIPKTEAARSGKKIEITG